MTDDAKARLREAIDALQPWATALDQTGGPAVHLNALIEAARQSLAAEDGGIPREPTDAMVKAAEQRDRGYDDGAIYRSVWRHMWDAWRADGN